MGSQSYVFRRWCYVDSDYPRILRGSVDKAKLEADGNRRERHKRDKPNSLNVLWSH